MTPELLVIAMFLAALAVYLREIRMKKKLATIPAVASQKSGNQEIRKSGPV